MEALDLKNELNKLKDNLDDRMYKQMSKVQDHVDKLDIKMNQKGGHTVADYDAIKSLVKNNFTKISEITKTQGLSLKLAGDMTLTTNLTGDQPRTYRDMVAMAPMAQPNMEDLINSISVDNGTFTFPRESSSEGSFGTPVEGTAKSQIDYDFTMIDVNCDFIAGYCRYSKLMRNNLPFLESFLPKALRRDYFKKENADFYTALKGAANTSSVVGSVNDVENIVHNQVALLALGYVPNFVIVNQVNYGNILLTAGQSGTGDYSLPGVVMIQNGFVTINGVAVVPVSWCPLNEYIIGQFDQCSKVTTEGLSLEFSESDGNSFVNNTIVARLESQVGFAIYRGDAFIEGSFIAV